MTQKYQKGDITQYNNRISKNNKFASYASNQPFKLRTKTWVEINDT